MLVVLLTQTVSFENSMDQLLERYDEKEIAFLKADSELLLATAKLVSVINSPEDESKAAEFLKQIKDKFNSLESIRTGLVKPLNDHVDRINASFKHTTVPLKEAEQIIKNGLTTHRNSQLVLAAKSEKLRLEEEARKAVSEGDVPKLETLSEAHREAAAIAPKTVSTVSGSMRYRKTWRYEIEDMEKLPASYWMIDEKKVKKAVEAGISIEGVKAWQEDVPVSY